MGRQSFVHIRLRADGGAATDIDVGGSVVPVLEGRLSLDSALPTSSSPTR
jgi:hypothetical protein